MTDPTYAYVRDLLKSFTTLQFDIRHLPSKVLKLLYIRESLIQNVVDDFSGYCRNTRGGRNKSDHTPTHTHRIGG